MLNIQNNEDIFGMLINLFFIDMMQILKFLKHLKVTHYCQWINLLSNGYDYICYLYLLKSTSH